MFGLKFCCWACGVSFGEKIYFGASSSAFLNPPPTHLLHPIFILPISQSLSSQTLNPWRSESNVGNRGAATPPEKPPTTGWSRRDATWPFTRRATSGLIPFTSFLQKPFLFHLFTNPINLISPIPLSRFQLSPFIILGQNPLFMFFMLIP